MGDLEQEALMRDVVKLLKEILGKLDKIERNTRGPYHGAE